MRHLSVSVLLSAGVREEDGIRTVIEAYEERRICIQ